MNNNTKIQAGVLGWPIGHSLSPRLHGYWLKKYGVNGVYEPLAVKKNNLKQKLKFLASEGYAGVNITVPHKEMALCCMDEVDEQAQRIGAINTVLFQPDGKMFGWNTDGFGFIENIKANISNWLPSNGPAVVLGAGGASRAICAALIENGVLEIRLINRTQSRAQILADHIGGPFTVLPWEERSAALEKATLLVNTTTLGMTGKSSLELDISKLSNDAVVNDIVYSPLLTPLLNKANKHGNLIVDGLGMLLHQARPGFVAWFGVEPEVTPELRNHVLRSLD